MKKITILFCILFALCFSSHSAATPRSTVQTIGQYITDSFYTEEPRELREIRNLFVSRSVAGRFNLKFNLRRGKEGLISSVSFNEVSIDISDDKATAQIQLIVEGPYKGKTRTSSQRYNFFLVKNEYGVCDLL
ncbi:hypothetical protein AADZ84_15955 [Colwelliaceae bacterium MEBiC 14330]